MGLAKNVGFEEVEESVVLKLLKSHWDLSIEESMQLEQEQAGSGEDEDENAETEPTPH